MVACLFGLTAVFTFAEMHVMKTVIRNADLKKVFLILLCSAATTLLFAQNAKQAAVQHLVESKNFIFRAQTVSPVRGNMRTLSSEYDLRLLGDSVVAYLPYFGRAYAATYGSGDGGIKFTSTQFEYTAKTKKKGWDNTIAPKHGSDVRQLFLSISPNGYARLQVLSNNRAQISYTGVLEVRKN